MFGSDEQSPMNKHMSNPQACASAVCNSICFLALPLAPLLIHLFFIHLFLVVCSLSVEPCKVSLLLGCQNKCQTHVLFN